VLVHDCWLVNTGWTGGQYGTDRRMPIKITRTLLNAALDGSLNDVAFRRDPNFGFQVPVPGVDGSILDPRTTWSDATTYDTKAKKLVTLFVENFRQFEDSVDRSVRDGAPSVAVHA
jgi:phosphoenolpyruvate carboxykinase (ATP)